MTDVYIKKGRAKPLWFGHPWLYSEAIHRVDGALEPGDEVRVLDDAGRVIGRGFANPRSQRWTRSRKRQWSFRVWTVWHRCHRRCGAKFSERSHVLRNALRSARITWCARWHSERHPLLLVTHLG